MIAADINAATRRQHEVLNKLIIERLPLALPPTAAQPDVLGVGLAAFAQIFFAFEDVWQEATARPETDGSSDARAAQLRLLLANLRPDGLARTLRLESDLERIAQRCSIDVRLRSIAPQQTIAHTMQRSTCAQPHLLVAYAWVMYMAIFSGGRWIRQQLDDAGTDFWSGQQQHMSLKPPSGQVAMTGLTFLSFHDGNDGEDLKAVFKERLAGIDALLSSKEREDIVIAAQGLFDDCIALDCGSTRATRHLRKGRDRSPHLGEAVESMAATVTLPPDASATTRRSSGRVRKTTQTYNSSPQSTGSKRKRSDIGIEDGDRQMPEDYESDEEEPSEEDEPDQEELRERARTARKTKAAAPKQSVPKKAKTNGTTLAMRPAVKRKPAKRSKAVNAEAAADVGGLFAEVFGDDVQFEVIAADWLKSFDSHESQALADMVNFILKCAGCDSTTSDFDIEDPDGVTNRLTDIQEEFQATAPTEYPLIAKGKAGTVFKQNLTGFLNAVVKSITASGKLYSAHELMENIEVWFSTMSSAGNRAFRHTATIASLSTMTALAEVAAERAKAAADWQRQATTERAKGRPNAGRIKDLDSRVGDATQAQQFITEQLRDWFEAVFIHRYRDVDPAIRRDCVVALTDWILTFPDYFFDATHLRYLGWVLSDTVGATRGEVVKQLQRVYKERNRLAGLQTFTERFRARLVEIATTDAESVVRASGIELLDLLREAELLEPDDIDAVGRLVYDSDPRVRKAVGHFFAEIVDGLYKSKVDELGGEEELAEALPEATVGSLDSPSLEWLEFKSVAEMMVAYDTANDLPTNAERNRDGVLTLHAAGADSRFTLAFDALYTKIESLKDWQSIAGYLLFDHSSRRSNGVANDPLSQLKDACILDQKEEAVLLEAICASVKHAIIDLAEKSNSTKTKLSKKQKEELSEDQEEAARHLAEMIPKLLNKFGDAPNTAAAVLRMESVLNLPSLRDLRQETVTYGSLLDDIRKQFMSHGTDEVLGPASEAIAHAKAYGELDDLTDDTVGTLWEDVVRNLAELVDPSTVTVRGSSDREQLSATSSNLLRITLLAQVADCTTALEDGSGLQSASASGPEFLGAIDYIIAFIQRALPSEGPAIEPEDAALEDEIATRASQATLRYLEWKIYLIMAAVASASVNEIPFDELEALATRRDQFATNLYSVLQARKPTEVVSINMAKSLLELHSSAVVLKTIKARPGMRDDWEVLIMNLHATYLKAVMKVFVAAEKTYADLTNKKLEDPISLNAEDDLDAEPLDEDPLSDSETEDEEDESAGRRREAKLRKTVIAEKHLCELAGKMIFAIHAGVADASMRTRLERNKTKLGPNFKELMVYMDLGQAAKSTKTKARAKAKGKLTANGTSAKAKPNPKSNAIVAEDEIDDEIEDHEEEEQAEVAGAEIESVASG